MKQYTRLSQAEREQIFLLLHEGYSLREIGARLGRVHTTLSRELKRQGGKGYSPVVAKIKDTPGVDGASHVGIFSKNLLLWGAAACLLRYTHLTPVCTLKNSDFSAEKAD